MKRAHARSDRESGVQTPMGLVPRCQATSKGTGEQWRISCRPCPGTGPVSPAPTCTDARRD